jgi:hypothetical protein
VSSRTSRVGLRTSLIAALGAFVVGGVLGHSAGRSTDPLIRIAGAPCEDVTGEQPQVSDALLAILGRSLAGNLELAARVGALERLAEDVREQHLSVDRLVAAALEEMSEEQIESALRDWVRLRDSQLAPIEDIRAFATRLAVVALQDTLIEEDGEGDRAGADEGDDEGRATVYFATERELERPSAAAETIFPDGTSSLYAIFAADRHDGAPAIFKWVRTDRPRLIMFRRLTMHAGDRVYDSFGIHGGAALSPGQYRVTLHAADESLEPIASGRYEIR